jgi:hypothetical protein
LVILNSSLFVILLVHFVFIIHLKRLFINVCNLLVNIYSHFHWILFQVHNLVFLVFY